MSTAFRHNLMMVTAKVLVAITAAGSASTADADQQMYRHSETYMGQDFFEPFRWSFHTSDDPTHGAVNYIGYSAAAIRGLVNATAERVYMGVDHSSTVDGRVLAGPGQEAAGRTSVRIMSRQTYNSGLFIVNLDHLPTGCGVWPAFWMYGEDPNHPWPSWGEFDIIEGVHLTDRVMTSLHTTSGCNQSAVQEGVDFSGSWRHGADGRADNCDVNAKGQWQNQGCSQAGPHGSMGAHFNKQGGGTFAAEWDPLAGHFRTWFWSRQVGVPQDIVDKVPNPSGWGRPYSFFSLSPKACSSDHFRNMRLVFDITFCGDLGAPTFAEHCAEVAKGMTCPEFVQNHPEEFKEAYWSIRGLDIYQAGKLSQDVVMEERPDAFGRFEVHPASDSNKAATSVSVAHLEATASTTPAPRAGGSGGFPDMFERPLGGNELAKTPSELPGYADSRYITMKSTSLSGIKGRLPSPVNIAFGLSALASSIAFVSCLAGAARANFSSSASSSSMQRHSLDHHRRRRHHGRETSVFSLGKWGGGADEGMFGLLPHEDSDDLLSEEDDFDP